MSIPTFSRRKALAVAAMVALTLGAAGAAVAANTGLLGGSHGSAPVGTLNAQNVSELLPVATAPDDPAQPSVRYVDEVYVEPAAAPVPAPVTGADPVTESDRSSSTVPSSPSLDTSVSSPAPPADVNVGPGDVSDGGHKDDHADDHADDHESHDVRESHDDHDD